MLSKRAIVLWLVAAVVAGATLVWRDQLWDLKRQWDAKREFAALVGDTAKYETCFATGFKGAECGRWQVKAQPNPEYWPYPDKPAFVWPDAPKQQVYKPGMTRVEYFEALCEAEAGEFIYKMVKAEGIYMIRPRMEETEDRMRDRYGIEDPYGYGQGDTWDRGAPGLLIGPIEHSRTSPPRYRYVETPQIAVNIPPTSYRYYDPSLFERPSNSEKYREFVRLNPLDLKGMRARHVGSISATVGFTWRGIRRPYDRELGIAGGEIAVIDLNTNQVLGLRRGFQLAQRLKTGGVWWLIGGACPKYSQTTELGRIRNRDKDIDYVKLFLTRVAIPDQVVSEK